MWRVKRQSEQSFQDKPQECEPRLKLVIIKVLSFENSENLDKNDDCNDKLAVVTDKKQHNKDTKRCGDGKNSVNFETLDGNHPIRLFKSVVTNERKAIDFPNDICIRRIIRTESKNVSRNSIKNPVVHKPKGNNRHKHLIHTNGQYSVKPSICDKCGNILENSDFESHPNVEMQFCQKCQNAERTFSLLRKHRLNRPEQLCTKCGKAFHSKDNLKHHMAIHSFRKDYACNLCGKEFQRALDVIKHRCKNSEVRPYWCDICAKTFKKNFELTRHSKNHSRDSLLSQHVCHSCGKSYKTRGTLAIHIRKNHTNEVGYICPECGETFASEVDQLQHLQIHSQGKPHSCPECGYAFSTQESMQRHFLANHTSARPHMCSECGNMFKTEMHLSEHKRSFHQSKHNYHCWHCNKMFRTRQAITKHVAIHVTEDPHDCSICGKRFKNSVALGKHVQTHSVEWSHVCQDCGRAFRTRDTLRHHTQSIHGGGNYHFCLECGKGYKCKKLLAQHVRRTHTTEHPHICPECGWAFKVKADLKKHQIRRHSKDKEYVMDLESIIVGDVDEREQEKNICIYCKQIFGSKDELSNHFCLQKYKKSFNDDDFHNPPNVGFETLVAKTPTQGSLYPCEHCNKVFRNKKSFITHQNKIHKEPGPHYYPICNKVLKCKGSLPRHLCTHEGGMMIKQQEEMLDLNDVFQQPIKCEPLDC